MVEDYRYMVEHGEPGVLTHTLHPQVIGRGHRMRMLDRLLTDGGQNATNKLAKIPIQNHS